MNIPALALALAAIGFGLVLARSLYADRRALRAAGVNGEIEHMVGGLLRTIRVRLVAAAIVASDAALHAAAHAELDDLLLVGVAFMLCLVVALDWYDRRVARTMAMYRRLAISERHHLNRRRPGGGGAA